MYTLVLAGILRPGDFFLQLNFTYKQVCANCTVILPTYLKHVRKVYEAVFFTLQRGLQNGLNLEIALQSLSLTVNIFACLHTLQRPNTINVIADTPVIFTTIPSLHRQSLLQLKYRTPILSVPKINVQVLKTAIHFIHRLKKPLSKGWGGEIVSRLLCTLLFTTKCHPRASIDINHSFSNLVS